MSMKKLLSVLVCIVVLFSVFVSCKKDDAIRYARPEKLSFTFVAYIIAENSLSGNAEPNIRDIERGVSEMNRDINVLVFVDDRASAPRLLEIYREDDGTVVRKTVKEWEETNVVDPSFMADVLKMIAAKYPAKSYGLDLWSHGMAWIPSNYPDGVSRISSKWFGEDNSEIMDIKDLNTALENSGVHFDFILFDACLMASVEVAYEIRDNADFIIASPIEIWEMGFPYVEIMKSLVYDDRHLRIAKAYSDYYNGEYSSEHGIEMTGAITVIDCTRLEHLATATKLLLLENKDRYAVNVGNKVIVYDRWRYHFLYDLGHYMNELVGKENTAEWFYVFNKAVIYNYSTPTFPGLNLDPENYTGLGTYIPREEYNGWNEYYKTLKWFEDTDYLPIY